MVPAIHFPHKFTIQQNRRGRARLCRGSCRCRCRRPGCPTSASSSPSGTLAGPGLEGTAVGADRASGKRSSQKAGEAGEGKVWTLLLPFSGPARPQKPGPQRTYPMRLFNGGRWSSTLKHIDCRRTSTREQYWSGATLIVHMENSPWLICSGISPSTAPPSRHS